MQNNEDMIDWKCIPFEELSLDMLYDILFLRTKVFVVEQNCPYADVDGKDRVAIHLCGYLDGELVAYCRLFKPGDYFEDASIGRFVVSAEKRKNGYGHLLMTEALFRIKRYFEVKDIVISGQLYLEEFYSSHGFKREGEPYLEDGIPHVRMRYV